MAMYLKDYVEVLDNFRKNWLMKNLFLILSDNPRKPKNEQLIAILAEMCNIIDPVMVKTKEFWIPDKKLRKFIESWELLRQVLANNIAAGKKQSEEYYADVIKMFLVDQMCDGSNCHTKSGTD